MDVVGLGEGLCYALFILCDFRMRFPCFRLFPVLLSSRGIVMAPTNKSCEPASLNYISIVSINPSRKLSRSTKYPSTFIIKPVKVIIHRPVTAGLHTSHQPLHDHAVHVVVPEGGGEWLAGPRELSCL
jgi:hypothetical protein